MRVYLDTAVILQGAFSRRSHVTDLLALDDVQFVSSSYTFDVEVDGEVREHAEDEAAELGAKVLVATFLAESKIEVVDVNTGLEKDAHHAAAAADLHCDWICTYNLKDFTESQVPPSTPPARTPRGLLRALDPRRQLIEFPHLGESGTLLVMARHNETGAYLGEILESDNGTLVYTDPDGVVVVRSPDGVETSARAPLPPPGYAYVFSFRYKADGTFDGSLWVSEDATFIPDGLTASSSGRVELIKGTAQFGSSSRAKLVFGANYGFAGELHGVTGTDRWVHEKELRLAIIDGTFDFHRSTFTGDLLERIETEQVGSTGEEVVIAVTLRSPNERSVLPVPP